MSRLEYVASITTLTAAALVLSACSKEPADARVGPQLVQVTSLNGDGHSSREFTGTVSARVQSDLGFRVPGKVEQRLVDTGQLVRRGQPLMRIDRTDLALATAAQAGTVAAARAKALQTAADERRYRDLVSAGAVSASAYDQAKAAADAAKAQLDAAQAQAGVARNEAGYSVLLADSDGVVVETLAEPGQVVSAGQTVVRLAHSGPREATVNLPETLRPAVGSSASATIFQSDASGNARLRQLSNAADPQTRTFEARYVLEGAAARAPLGSTVTLRLADATAVPQTEIPLSSILDDGHGPGVWVVGGSPLRVSWRPVHLVRLGEETATISGGLSRGDRFVALGAHLLHQGQLVRLTSDQVAAR